MSEIYVRDSKCENCAKFSHCNNNDLVCIKKFQQLKSILDDIYEICSNSLSVKLLFKDRIDLAIFIRKRIKEVKENG